MFILFFNFTSEHDYNNHRVISFYLQKYSNNFILVPKIQQGKDSTEDKALVLHAPNPGSNIL